MPQLTDFLQTTQGKLISGAIVLILWGSVCGFQNDPPLEVSDEAVLV
jgi:hypothetical protein